MLDSSRVLVYKASNPPESLDLSRALEAEPCPGVGAAAPWARRCLPPGHHCRAGLPAPRGRPRWERASFWNPTRWTPQSLHIHCRSKRRQIGAGEPPGALRAAGAICPPAGGFSGQGAGGSPQPRVPESRGIPRGIPENAGHGPRCGGRRLSCSDKILGKEKARLAPGFSSADSGRRFLVASVSQLAPYVYTKAAFATLDSEGGFFFWVRFQTT